MQTFSLRRCLCALITIISTFQLHEKYHNKFREAGSIKKARNTTKAQMALPSHVHHWWGNYTSVPWLPLVEPFGEERNAHTKQPIYYKPDIGYSFPMNGQGGKLGNKFYNATVLHYKLEPDKVFTAGAAIECLSHQQLNWIHIDGDSLARDVYYDFTELFGMNWNNKKKTLVDMSFWGMSNGTASNATPFIPRFSFSGNTVGELQQVPNWYGDSNNGSVCPDLWVYSSGLWDHPAKTSLEQYRERTQLLADFVNNTTTKKTKNSPPSPCQVRHKILRHTTPYHIKARESLNQMAVEYNAIATELFVPIGFRYVDTFEILKPRKDLSHDGVHYTGPGSKWVTNAILNLVC